MEEAFRRWTSKSKLFTKYCMKWSIYKYGLGKLLVCMVWSKVNALFLSLSRSPPGLQRVADILYFFLCPRNEIGQFNTFYEIEMERWRARTHTHLRNHWSHYEFTRTHTHWKTHFHVIMYQRKFKSVGMVVLKTRDQMDVIANERADCSPIFIFLIKLRRQLWANNRTHFSYCHWPTFKDFKAKAGQRVE